MRFEAENTDLGHIFAAGEGLNDIVIEYANHLYCRIIKGVHAVSFVRDVNWSEI